MKHEEADQLQDELWNRIQKKGMPINVRNGSNEDAANWINDTIDSIIEKYYDEPLGTVRMAGYDGCPKCMGIIGLSAYYCKACGAWIREKGKK